MNTDDLHSRYGPTDSAKRRRLTSSMPRWDLMLLPAAAMIVLIAFPLLNRNPVVGNRSKGRDGGALYVYRKTDDGAEQLFDGDAVSASDLIQIKYLAGSLRYGVIVSLDGRGVVSVHLPETGSRAAELPRGKPDTLGFSYELDDAPTAERFYFVESDTPFLVDRILPSLRIQTVSGSAAELDLPDSFVQRIFTLKKDQAYAN